jgi:hypothetical protein
MKADEEQDFCSICGHLIPDRMNLGGCIDGVMTNYVLREAVDVRLHICSECIMKLDEIEMGGVSGAQKRARVE